MLAQKRTLGTTALCPRRAAQQGRNVCRLRMLPTSSPNTSCGVACSVNVICPKPGANRDVQVGTDVRMQQVQSRELRRQNLAFGMLRFIL